ITLIPIGPKKMHEKGRREIEKSPAPFFFFVNGSHSPGNGGQQQKARRGGKGRLPGQGQREDAFPPGGRQMIKIEERVFGEGKEKASGSVDHGQFLNLLDPSSPPGPG